MYRKSFINLYLANGFECEEAKSEVDFAISVLFNYDYKDFILGKVLENWQINKLKKVFEERVKTRKPIQQIIGQAYFFGRLFFVDKYTLVPRPETELLVNEVLDILKDYKSAEILDIGTGTGCIGLTLRLENPNLNIDMSDIQQGAIEIAKKNALFLNVLSGVNFIKSDLFENIEKKYDLIVSNPPYIPLKDKNNLQVEVRDFDSPLALFAEDEKGLEYYEKIISQANKYLKTNGYLAFELGINQADYVKEILKQNGFSHIKVTKDYNNIERIITAQNFIV